MSLRTRLLFFATAWAIVLMPFLFWRATWFGRPLTNQEMTEYLHDDQKPRHIQHALVQMGERIARRAPETEQWYPDLVRLASYPVEEVRNTDAWVMGQDNTQAAFHQALLKMLQDTSPTVRGNAALSLVRFGDASGHDQLLELLKPASVAAPSAGTVVDAASVGTAVHQGGTVAKLKSANGEVEARTPISGRVRDVLVRTGTPVEAGHPLATVAPEEAQVWEALRALYIVGKPEDAGLIRTYEREQPDMSERVRQQAVATEKAVLTRSAKQ